MSTADLLRVWRRVETLPVPSFVEAEWRELLGEDYGTIRTYLQPERELASGYRCPDPVHDGCPRRVVQHSPTDIVAVCGNPSPLCETVRLSREALIVWSLDSASWTTAVTARLREANGLAPLDAELQEGFLPLGVLQTEGKRFAVVWQRSSLPHGELVAQGLVSTLRCDGLIVILPPGTSRQSDCSCSAGSVVLLAPPESEGGFLDLGRALDFLDPRHRERRIADPDATFDHVRIEFAEEPSVRHIVRINGEEFAGFQKSDIKFLRLVLLAAIRAKDPDVQNGGWMKKSRLRGGEDRDRDLERLRAELAKHPHASVSPVELKALIKSKRGAGEIRLAVRPANVRFDESLSRFAFLSEPRAGDDNRRQRQTPGMARLSQNLSAGLKNCRLLMQDARKLGVPLPP